MTRNFFGIRALTCILAIVIAQPNQRAVLRAQAPAKPRPMEVEDLLRSERILEVVPSPDGALIAVVVRRPATTHERYQQGTLVQGRADIWLVQPDGSERRNITNGAADASGYWLPTWSPDGQHLAMVSTKGGDNARAYVWSRRDGALKRLSDTGLDLMANADPSGGNWNIHPFAWVSSTELAIMLLPPGGVAAGAEIRTAAMHRAMKAWPKAERGLEPTVSVLETGPDLRPMSRLGSLTLVDVVSGRQRILANVPMEENTSGQRQFLLSPSRRHAVVLTSETRSVDARQRRLTRTQSRHRIGIVSLEAMHPGVRWVDTVSASIGQRFEHVIRWSPQDTCVAILAKWTTDLDGPSRVYVISTTGGVVRRLLPDDWDTVSDSVGREIPLERANVVWMPDGRPIVYARPPESPAESKRSRRFDWWLIDPSREPRNMTASMPDVPTTFTCTTGCRSLVGVANGKLWTLDSETATAVAADLPPIREVAWPSHGELPVATLSRFVVDVGSGHTADLYEVTAGMSNRARRIAVPPRSGTLIAYVPSRSLVIFTDGTHRVTVGDGDRVNVVLTVNNHAPGIELPAQQLITYRGADGDTLRAVLVLPNGYVPGRRYPLIAHVYAGWIFRDTVALENELNDDVKLYAAHGYAVLMPSMPLRPTTMPSDPYIDIPKGVIAAVDRAIDLGIADPARLGVTGISYGAYSTYVLITSTTRFRAAVAELGPADLIADYGAFRATERYSDQPHLTLANAKMAESGQIRMGTHPWNDLWRYLKNSPFYFFDRVETPLLIIQGDQDMVGMEQIEGVFTALRRLGKRGQLVRYWGEWHGLDSPANIRDSWQRKLAWFDRFLGVPGRAPAPGQ